MAGMSSRPIMERVVYAQDAPPADERDGVIWVDTTTEKRQLHVYSEQTAQFEPVKTDVPVFVTEEAVTFQESGPGQGFNSTEVDSHNGTIRLVLASTGPITSRNADNDSFSSSNDTGVRIEANRALDGVYGSVSANTTGVTRAYLFRIEDGGGRTRIADTAINTGSFAFDVPLEAGRRYDITADAEGASFTKGLISGHSAPHAGDALDIIAGSGDDVNNIWCVNDIGSRQGSGPGVHQIHLGQPEEDLVAWDLKTWQSDPVDGTLSFRIDVDDGSGWTTHATNVTSPYDISGIDPSWNIRLHTDMDTTARSPRLKYVARRGERS